ncbi:hypothetical protein EDC04DRAFT_165727 [Pisolithus marmoratus]|nr:hypothetical protein EDC04DRAFT_164884 [Pisolithus marmoratus]KAI6027225.1 hypothetical protein EDC04DRAFT_165727 [Pisolithus marmoratus]
MVGGWERWRVTFVFDVINKWLRLACDFDPCPKVRELWLQIVEGLVDDDVWLWADGDEEWLRGNQGLCWGIGLPRDGWADAQSALRRRIAEQRYPTVTGIHEKRNERIRNATPAQRICAIAWLIASSKGVAELFAFHGRTPPTFRTPKIASILSNIIGKCWDAFPSQSSSWENALVKSKEDGCIHMFTSESSWYEAMVQHGRLVGGYSSHVGGGLQVLHALSFLTQISVRGHWCSAHGDFACVVVACPLQLSFPCKPASFKAIKPDSRVTGGQKTGTADEETWIRFGISSLG